MDTPVILPMFIITAVRTVDGLSQYTSVLMVLGIMVLTVCLAVVGITSPNTKIVVPLSVVIAVVVLGLSYLDMREIRCEYDLHGVGDKTYVFTEGGRNGRCRDVGGALFLYNHDGKMELLSETEMKFSK